jgi:hypothetical protein
MLRATLGLCLILTFGGCSGDQAEPLSPQDLWIQERLQPGLLISFPSSYEGEGYRCGIDACYFDKKRPDHSVLFGFPVMGMTGYDPAEFDVLPGTFQYRYRELIETRAGLEGALYFTPQDEHEFDWSLGTFVVKAPDGPGYREVLWVTYKPSHHGEVREVLETVQYE